MFYKNYTTKFSLVVGIHPKNCINKFLTIFHTSVDNSIIGKNCFTVGQLQNSQFIYKTTRWVKLI